MDSKKMLSLIAAAALAAALMLTACGESQVSSASSASEAASDSVAASKSSSAAESTAPLKENPSEAEYQIQKAMQYQLEKAYGNKVNDARIYVEKIYTAGEEQANELLKSYNLGPDEIAFEVRCELHPANGVDVHELLAATGEYDEESGWVVDKYNVGILRPNAGGEPPYVITDFGTSF